MYLAGEREGIEDVVLVAAAASKVTRGPVGSAMRGQEHGDNG